MCSISRPRPVCVVVALILVFIASGDLGDTLLASFASKDPEALRGPIKLHIEGSEGVDMGGVIKGAMSALAEQLNKGANGFALLDNREVRDNCMSLLCADVV